MLKSTTPIDFGNKIVVEGLNGSGSKTIDANSLGIEQVTSTEISQGPKIRAQEIHTYPNPANPSVTISFLNPAHSVQISIYNVHGKQVASFKNLKTNKVTWNASGLANGIYQVRITSSGKTYAKQITLLK